MARWWTKVVDRVWDHLVLDEPSPRRPVKQAIETGGVEAAIEKARAEWLAARTYFDNVTDPDLIDHAIYSIEAAERKYMYLLRHAQEFGYQIPADPSQPFTSSGSDTTKPQAHSVEVTKAEKAGLTARPV